jgi:alpha-tubulin suppressor-like RCC1 family protein
MDGSVRCWGDDTYGELGDGQTERIELHAVDAPGFRGATELALGTFHTCALYPDRTVQCVGRNSYGNFGNGALGDGTAADRATLAPVVGLSNVVHIAAGAFHTCAVLGDGTVRCWGGNTYGQCGDGTRDDQVNQGRLSPVQVSGITDAVRVAAGEIHTCALLADETVACWGTNAYGNLGTGTKNDTHLTPVPVAGLSGVVSISVGSYHSCALIADGTMKCWGDNGWGQLGDGTTTQRLVPTTVVIP